MGKSLWERFETRWKRSKVADPKALSLRSQNLRPNLHRFRLAVPLRRCFGNARRLRANRPTCPGNLFSRCFFGGITMEKCLIPHKATPRNHSACFSWLHDIYEIGAILSLSSSTVDNHKFDASDTCETDDRGGEQDRGWLRNKCELSY